MTDAPIVQFVTAPTDAAEVLFDCQYDGRVLHQGFSLGAPESIEGGWGSRTVTVPLRLHGPRVAAMQRHSMLARTLLRREFYMRYQQDAASTPVWFKVTDTAPGDLSFDGVFVGLGDNDFWEVTVTLTCDPFALGERITLPPVSISNDPAAGTHRMSYVLPDVVGDAEAPLRVDVTPGGTDGQRWLWSSLATPAGSDATVANAPVFWQVGAGDAWTAGTDTGAASSNVAYSGGSYRAVSFSTNADMATRLSSSTQPAILPGQYLVAVRCARSDTDSTFTLRFGQAFLGFTYGETVRFDRPSSTAAGHAEWVVLGEFRFPFDTTEPPADIPGLSAAYGFEVAIQAQRLSGSGSLYLDAVALFPTRAAGNLARTLRAHMELYGADRLIIDGDKEASYGLNSLDRLNAGSPHGSGSFLAVTPGRRNVVKVLQNAGNTKTIWGTDNSDAISNTLAATFSYQPRWLYLGDGS